MAKAERNEYDAIMQTVEKEPEALFAKQNVVGLGAGNKILERQDFKDTGKPCLTVFVAQKLLDPELIREQDMIPEDFQGIPTDVIEIGEIFAGDAYVPDEEQVLVQEEAGIEALTRRIRPAMGGYSVGHYKITAGTIGTCVYDLGPFPGIPRKYYILSNNHVLANSNNARVGDPILQPGPVDGGRFPGDMIARLSRFVPIKFITPTTTPINYVDAAIAEGDFHSLNREIFWIGYVKQVNSRPQVGDLVEKTGRTTNFTTGKILATNAILDVNYGGGRVARFARQIVASNMSAPGDSGSLVCDIKEGVVGLLFAGSTRATIINNILFVQNLLRIRLHP